MTQEKLEAVVRIVDEVPDGVAPLRKEAIPLDERGRIPLEEGVYAEVDQETGGVRYFAPSFPEEGVLAGGIKLPLGFEGRRHYSVKEIRNRSEE